MKTQKETSWTSRTERHRSRGKIIFGHVYAFGLEQGHVSVMVAAADAVRLFDCYLKPLGENIMRKTVSMTE